MRAGFGIFITFLALLLKSPNSFIELKDNLSTTLKLSWPQNRSVQLCDSSEPGQMEIFKEVSIFLGFIGLLEIEHTKGKYIRVILAVLAFSAKFSAVLTTCWYCVFDAESLEQQAEALPMTDAFIYVLSSYCLFLSGRSTMIRLMRSMQLLIRKRSNQFPTAKQIYITANEQIEWVSQIVKMLLFRSVIPFYIVPPMLKSYFDYYVRNRSADMAFRLPIPAS